MLRLLTDVEAVLEESLACFPKKKAKDVAKAPGKAAAPTPKKASALDVARQMTRKAVARPRPAQGQAAGGHEAAEGEAASSDKHVQLAC